VETLMTVTAPFVAQIAVYNQAQTPLPFALPDLIAAMQVYVDECLTPVWGCRAKLVMTQGPVKSAWGMVFLDTADAPGALAYHDEESHMPLAKIFVKTTLDDGQDVAVSATHELAEMLVDAPCNRWANAGDFETMWAYEVCDPVENDSFLINGLAMSNFVVPAFFESDPLHGQTKFDHMGTLTQPFSLAPGGYAVITRASEFQYVFGSVDKELSREHQDRRGHRSWFRQQAMVKP
jgi:hypothetical protein